LARIRNENNRIMIEENSASNNASDREIAAMRIFNTPREKVFKIFTDPKHITHWWGPNGFTTTTHEMDMRSGGVWRFTMHGPDGVDYKNKVVYIEVVRPERLVYKHAGEGEHSGIHFVATVTFTDLGGKTRLDMRMRFDTAEELEEVATKHGAVEGLTQTLSRLEAFLAEK